MFLTNTTNFFISLFPIIDQFYTSGSCRLMAHTAAVLDIQKGSHMITKLKPKIRIVHIFAPEIIKTDPANFRELVQRLTGKAAATAGRKAAGNKRKIVKKKQDDDHHKIMRSSSTTSSEEEEEVAVIMDQRKKQKVRDHEEAYSNYSMMTTTSQRCYGELMIMKEEEEEEEDQGIICWGGENPDGSFGALEDFDGLVQGLVEFPFLPLITSSEHRSYGCV